MRIKLLTFVLGLGFGFSSLNGAAAALQPLTELLNNWGTTATTFKQLDFDTTDRVALPINIGTFKANIGIDLGGSGCGMPLLPLPVAQQPHLDFSNGSLLSPDASRFARVGMRIAQEKLTEFLGVSAFGNDGENIVDFFDESGASVQKKHWLEKMINFRVTPGMVYGIKLALLMKHFVQHGRQDGVKIFRYLIDWGVLSIRLLRSWRRDSSRLGGISAIIDQNAPVLSGMLKKVSLSLGDEMFLHRKLDTAWRVIMEADGLIFGQDGSVQRGLGFAVSGLTCQNAAQAEQLEAFFNSPQINWEKLESQDLSNASFQQMAVKLLDIYGKQIASASGDSPMMARAKEYQQLKAALNQARYAEYPRYDLSPDESDKSAHALGHNKEFTALLAPGGALSSYQALPKVVRAGNQVMYCSNKVGPIDAGRLLAIIFFQALWRYMDVVRGHGEQGKRMRAEIQKGHDQQVHAEQYLQTAQGKFLALPLQVMLARKTNEFYQLAAPHYTKEKKLLVGKLIADTAAIRVRGAQRRGQEMRALAAKLGVALEEAKK